MRRKRVALVAPVGLLAALAVLSLAPVADSAAPKTCRPGAVDEPPNDTYRPGSPVRSVAGRGHVLSGFVRSKATCRGIARAKLEFFHAGPDGNYSDGVTSWAGRATVLTRPDGSYRFESRFPSNSAGVPPHIHFRVSAPGFETLNGTYFTLVGKPHARLTLVLTPAS